MKRNLYYFIIFSFEKQIDELKIEKSNLVEEIVTHQENFSKKTEVFEKKSSEFEQNKEVLASKDSKIEDLEKEVERMLLKLTTVESEKRNLEKKVVEAQVEVASTKIDNNDSG